MGFSTPPGHRNPTYDENTNGLIDRTEGVNIPDYTEDPNSPVDVTAQDSVTFTPQQPADEILIKSSPTVEGFTALRVNGDTGSNYDTVDSNDTNTNGRDQFEFNKGRDRATLRIRGVSNQIGISQTLVTEARNYLENGSNANVSGPITQFTIRNRFGNPVDARFRVYTIDI